MIIVPAGRALTDDRPGPNSRWARPGFGFRQRPAGDLIPFVESVFVKQTASRQLAGLSMGGGQSLNFGLGNLDTFAWVEDYPLLEYQAGRGTRAGCRAACEAI